MGLEYVIAAAEPDLEGIGDIDLVLGIDAPALLLLENIAEIAWRWFPSNNAGHVHAVDRVEDIDRVPEGAGKLRRRRRRTEPQLDLMAIERVIVGAEKDMVLEATSFELTADLAAQGDIFRVPVTVATLPGQKAELGMKIEQLAPWSDFRVARKALECAGAIAGAEQ